jgi:hypothetical protein
MKLMLLALWSCGSALLSGCGTTPGDFCDIAEPDVYSTAEVVEFLLDNDPTHIRKDLAENEYGKKNCGWTALPSKGD